MSVLKPPDYFFLRACFCRVLVFLCLVASGCSRGEPSGWEQYCRADQHDTARSWARRENPLVARAQSALEALPADSGILIPPDMRRLYRLRQKASRQFVDVLCSEYRDDVSRLRAKFELLAGIIRVPEETVQTYSPSKQPIRQLTADGYRSLVMISRSIQDFRLSRSSASSPERYPALGVCEFRFLLKDYLAKHRGILTLEDFNGYEQSLQIFLQEAAESGECSPEELDSFYTFRGAGYISPTEPEAAVMRQTGAAYRDSCGNSGIAASWFSAAHSLCTEFFEQPHQTRRAAALQLLRRLFFGGDLESFVLKNRWHPYFPTSDIDGDGVGEAIIQSDDKESRSLLAKEFGIKLYSSYLKAKSSKPEAENPRIEAPKRLGAVVNGTTDAVFKMITANGWRKEYKDRPDQGLSSRYDLQTAGGRKQLREAFQTVINRHAFYYQSFWFMPPFEALFASVTPFLSTSSYLAQAHKFSLGGFAAGKMKKPRLNWLYVFRIRSSNLYGSGEIAEKQPVEFERHWLEEATLANHSLAIEENGLDRFIEPAPEELEALLYLGDCIAPAELLALLQSEGEDESTADDLSAASDD